MRKQAVAPEASRPGVVVVVDVGDRVGEPDGAGSVRVVIDPSGHAEGCPLLDVISPAVTQTTVNSDDNDRQDRRGT